MFLVAANLTREITDSRDTAMACPPQPGLEFLLGRLNVIQLQQQAQGLLDPVGTIEPGVLLSNHLQPNFLVFGKILRGFAESIGRTLDFRRLALCGGKHSRGFVIKPRA